MRQDRRIFYALAFLILLSVAVWLAARDSDAEKARGPASLPQTSSNGEWQAQLVRLAAAQAKSGIQGKWPFTGLRRAIEPMPRALRRRAVVNLGGRQILGLRFDQAQYAPTAVGGGVWVVRGNHLTCIFQAVKAASSCATNATAFEQGLHLVVGLEAIQSRTELPRHFLALGIQPDDVKAVQLRPAGARVRAAPVLGNVFSLRARSPIYFEGVIR